MIKILLLGKNGQLGWELQRALSPLGEVYSLGRHPESGLCGDLSNLQGLAQTVRRLAPDVVVNAAAYTAVDKAEAEVELVRLVNEQAPAVLAQEVAALGGWFIHYSSDYVFNGAGTNFWKETDRAAPLNSYGQSKLAGEAAIQASGCKHLIFRTSWVYGVRGTNFVKTILRLARERSELTIVADQIGTPSGADFLADCSAHALTRALAQAEVSGLYHLAPKGITSWHGYAQFVIDQARVRGEALQVETLRAIASSDYPMPAQRPLNSRLATTKFSDTFSLNLPHWEPGVARMLDETLRIEQ